jgi:hypothetical protein
MLRVHASLLSLIVLTTCSVAQAADQHIVCSFSGTACNGCERKDDKATRTLTFFLDDANKQLVAEGGPVTSARTTSYSDTEVRAEIQINSLPANGAAQIAINRAQGTAVFSALLLPAGVDIETGDCHEVAGPQTQ